MTNRQILNEVSLRGVKRKRNNEAISGVTKLVRENRYDWFTEMNGEIPEIASLRYRFVRNDKKVAFAKQRPPFLIGLLHKILPFPNLIS